MSVENRALHRLRLRMASTDDEKCTWCSHQGPVDIFEVQLDTAAATGCTKLAVYHLHQGTYKLRHCAPALVGTLLAYDVEWAGVNMTSLCEDILLAEWD